MGAMERIINRGGNGGWMNHPASPSGSRLGRPERLRPAWAALALLMILSPAMQARGAYVEDPDLGDATAGVLLYLDDAQYRWADVPVTGNFTALCATLAACARANVPLNYSMSQYGAYVTSLFGTGSPNDYSWWWELLLWNDTALAWQEAPVGASDLRLEMWDCIAWCPNWSAPPLPDPLTKYPSPKFRGNIANTGYVPIPLPQQVSASGYAGLANGPIDTTPAVAHGRIYISTGGVYNWSRMGYEASPQLFSLPTRHDSPASVSHVPVSYVSASVHSRDTTAAGWQVSSPAVGAGKVVIGTSDGKVLAFSMDRLEPLWNFSISASATGVTSSPVIFRDVVYIAGGDGLLYGLSLDGEQLWNLSLEGPAYMSTPAISDGRLFVGSDAGVLTCAALNGTRLWNFTAGGKIRSSPAVSGGRVFFENTVYDGLTVVGSTLFSIGAGNGTQVWNRTIPASTSSPAINGEALFLGTNTGVIAYDLQGHQLWFHATQNPIQSSPLVAGDVVIVTENARNGNVRWLSTVDGRSLQNDTPMGRYLFSSPVFAGDLFLYATDDGVVFITFYQEHAAPMVVSWLVPENPEPGKKVQIRINFTNKGDLASRDIKLVLKGNRNRVIDAPLNISHLAPGHNITLVFNWTPQEGDNHLWLSIMDWMGVRGGSTRDIEVSGDRPYPADRIYISTAVFAVAAASVAFIFRKRSRKGGG